MFNSILIITKRLLWTLNKLEVRSNCQNGFILYLSTLHHLLDFQNIHFAFINHQYLISIFFSYDTAWRHGVLRKQITADVWGHTAKFVANFLHNRHIQIRVSNTLYQTYYVDGVSQGSVLSVYCFLPLINIISTTSSLIQAWLYTDDFNISIQTKNLEYASNILQLSLNNLQKYSVSTGDLTFHL